MALGLAAGADAGLRRLGLSRLRDFNHVLRDLQRHFEEQDRDLDSIFEEHLDWIGLKHLCDKHSLLHRWSNGFQRELRFATSLGGDEVVRQGRKLLDQIRHHMAFEEELMKGIEVSVRQPAAQERRGNARSAEDLQRAAASRNRLMVPSAG